MSIPTSANYVATRGVGLRTLRESIVSAMFAELRSASSFADVSAGAQRFVARAEMSGFQFRLLDEDGESMISYGVDLGNARSVTAQAYWDEDEGPSVSCVFHEGTSHVVFAQSRVGGVVEVEPRS